MPIVTVGQACSQRPDERHVRELGDWHAHAAWFCKILTPPGNGYMQHIIPDLTHGKFGKSSSLTHSKKCKNLLRDGLGFWTPKFLFPPFTRWELLGGTCPEWNRHQDQMIDENWGCIPFFFVLQNATEVWMFGYLDIQEYCIWRYQKQMIDKFDSWISKNYYKRSDLFPTIISFFRPERSQAR